MKNQPKRSTPPDADLRQRAEKQLKDDHLLADTARTEADTQCLVHELQVHQIELEMQNTELQRARLEVETALAKYTELYDFAPMGYLTLDLEGKIHEANLAGAALLGVSRSELPNQRLQYFVSPPDHATFTRFIKEVFSSKTRKSCELSLRVKDNPALPVELDAVVSDCGRMCRVALTDITERKHAEETRLILSKLESTGILAGGIAHDFNNLLASIVLGLDFAQRLGFGNDELVESLKDVKVTALNARRLTQQLLTFSKGGEPVAKVTSMPEVIRESARLALSGSPLRCDFSVAADLWPVMIDQGQIAQVVHNLVLNAREAMPGSGVISVDARNEIRQAHASPNLPPGRYVRIAIVDHGIGISSENLAKIFDPYFSTKERGNQKGMGLGLTICHTIVKRQGGAITVKSETGKGTTVELLLPAASQSAATAKPPAEPGHLKLLVMEDEEILRKTYGQTIRMMGHQVELVANGKSAVEAFQTAINQGRPFDAVILDLTICDGMGGRETIQVLRQLEPRVKAIVMSGYTNDPVIALHEQYGFSGVLEKPFDLQQLQEALAAVMGR